MAGYDWTFNFLIRNDGSQSMQGMRISKDYFRLMGLKTALGHGFDDSDFGQGHVTVDCAGVRVLEARVWRRSADYRQDDTHQPLGLVAGCGRNHGAGSALSALAGSCKGAQLRRQRYGRSVDTRGSRPEGDEGSRLERSRTVAGRSYSATRPSGARRARHN